MTRPRTYLTGILAAVLAFALPAPGPAHALSEIQREELSPPAPESGPGVPLPDSGNHKPAAPGRDAPTLEPEEPASPPDIVEPPPVPDIVTDGKAPRIRHDISALPEPVRRMRARIMEACLSGDIERLRPLIGAGDGMTQLSLGDLDMDPIEHLKAISGDGEGHEILAILYEVMEAGYVHLDEGTPLEVYMWPYYFAVPLDELTAEQRVELFMLVTAGDYQDMIAYGGYNFYRAGITPEGRWVVFVAGH